MERVLILGCGGSGKSTLARQLGALTGLEVIHLDRLFWRADWKSLSREEFDAVLAQELEKPRWIMDGNYDRTVSVRLKKCDTVIFLDYSRWTCLYGVCKRVLMHYGKTRPDMGGGCPERFDLEFMKWVWNYNRDRRPKMLKLLEDEKHAQILIFRNRRGLRAFLKEFSAKIERNQREEEECK